MPIDPLLIAAAESGTGYFTTLAKITARPEFGGDEVRVALSDRAITFESALYEPAPFTPSQMQNKAEVQADNGSVRHILTETLSRQNIAGRKWSGATVEIIQIDHRNPGLGALKRHKGRMGESKLTGRESETEYHGLMDLLAQPIGDRTSMKCRLVLGDEFCGVNVAAFTSARTVTNVSNKQKFTVGGAGIADEYYKFGKAVWVTGGNAGLSMETQDNVNKIITLFQPMLAPPITIGDTLNLVAGDDKSFATCCNKFSNPHNFGGEPDMPTRDSVFKIPE